jgi:beta-lactamase class A
MRLLVKFQASMNKAIKYLGFGLLTVGGIAIALLTRASATQPDSPAAPTMDVITPTSPAWTVSAPTYSSSTPDLKPAASVPPTFPPDFILADQIVQILPDYGGDWNILVRAVHADGTRDMVAINANRKDHVASLIKLPIAMLFFKTLEARGIPPEAYETYLSERGIERTYMQLLTAMLVESEEAATGIMMEIIADSMIDVPAILEAWGAPDTDIRTRHSTPRDIATLYEELYYGNAIAHEGREVILRLLSTYTENDDTRLGVLRPYLREGSAYYNKRGTVTQERLIVADSALIAFDSNEVYVIVIVAYAGEHPTTDVKLVQGIEAIARTLWDFIKP